MEGVPAEYLGRLVSKQGFRTYVYAADGLKKLVNSWDEYQKHMETGIWFAIKPEPKQPDILDESVEVKPTKPTKPKKAKAEKVEEPQEEADFSVEPDDGLAFEVKDDFLSEAK